jgi:hypothetical protein
MEISFIHRAKYITKKGKYTTAKVTKGQVSTIFVCRFMLERMLKLERRGGAHE